MVVRIRIAIRKQDGVEKDRTEWGVEAPALEVRPTWLRMIGNELSTGKRPSPFAVHAIQTSAHAPV